MIINGMNTQWAHNILFKEMTMIGGNGKKKLIFMASLSLAALCCMTVFLIARAAEPVGKFSQIDGSVDVLRGGALPGIPVKAGDPVFIKDVIRTKSGSKAEIIFMDGNTVKISQRSRVDISEYLSEETRSSEILRVQRGKVEAIVLNKNAKRISVSPSAHKFEIHTPCAVTGVRSTKYGVAQGDNCSVVLVSEGTVYVFNPKFPDKVVEVHAGQITKVCEDSPPLQPRTATEEEKKKFELLGAEGVNLMDNIITTTPPRPGIDVQPPVTDIYPGLLEPKKPVPSPSSPSFK